MWSKYFQEVWSTIPYENRSEGGSPTSLQTYRAIVQTIVETAAIRPEDRVLDLGCSIGAITRELARHCRQAVGVDFVEDSLRYAREHNNAENVAYINSDLATFTTADRFDYNVIHCLDSWGAVRRLLGHCWDRLEPGGRLYLGEVPDTRKFWRYVAHGNRRVRTVAHALLPNWSFPLIARATGRDLRGKVFWFNPGRISRILGCPRAWVSVHDRPGTLLNPIERSHFVAHKVGTSDAPRPHR
jgi:SAM-dependent methyltransferase